MELRGEEKIAGFLSILFVAAGFLFPAAAYADSPAKTVRLRSVETSQLSPAEAKFMASGKLTLSARDAGSEILLVYKGSGGRLADTGSDQKAAIPYYAAGIILIVLGGYFAVRSKKGFLAVVAVAGFGAAACCNNTPWRSLPVLDQARLSA